MLPEHGAALIQYDNSTLDGTADHLPTASTSGTVPMDPVTTWALGVGFAVLSSAFGYTHHRINQVRSEAIDIADRNKKDVNTVADLLRAEFTIRMSDLKDAHEKHRREGREDMQRMQDGQEKFREEVRFLLKDMRADILDAVGARNTRYLGGPNA